MPVAKNSAELEKMIMDQVQKAMQATQVKIKADMLKETKAFYSQGSPSFFPFFMASITGNYIIGTAMIRLEGNSTFQKKLVFAVGLAGNIGLLGYYKYTDFFIENYNLLTGSDVALKHIILPIGISFFTFQLIAYLVDCYRGETKQYDFINYLLFITSACDQEHSHL